MIKMSSTLQLRMKKDKFPHKLTLETIEKAEKDIGLHNYNTIQEFIDDLTI